MAKPFAPKGASAKKKPAKKKVISKAKAATIAAANPDLGTASPKPAKGSKVAGLRAMREANASTTSVAVTVIGNGSDAIAAIKALKTFADFEKAGMVLLRRSTEAVFWFSHFLLRAKGVLTKEEFDQLGEKLSVAHSTAQQYIVTAQSERMAKLWKDGADLPPNAHTLYLLASMSDDEFATFSQSHRIERDMPTSLVRAFRVEYKDRASIAHQPKTTRQATQAATEQAANEATAPVTGDDAHTDAGAFGDAPEAAEANGSPNLPSDAAVRSTAALDTFKEIGQSLQSLDPKDISACLTDADASDYLTFATQVAEHAEDIRKAISDAEWAIKN